MFFVNDGIWDLYRQVAHGLKARRRRRKCKRPVIKVAFVRQRIKEVDLFDDSFVKGIPQPQTKHCIGLGGPENHVKFVIPAF